MSDRSKVLDYSRRRTHEIQRAQIERIHESHPAEYTRVYIGPYSKHAHLIDAGSGVMFAIALCSVRGRGYWESWFGTGTFAESQHATALPLCASCDATARYLAAPVRPEPVDMSGSTRGEER